MRKSIYLLILAGCVLGLGACGGGQSASGSLTEKMLDSLLDKDTKEKGAEDSQQSEEETQENGEDGKKREMEEIISEADLSSPQGAEDYPEISIQKSYANEWNSKGTIICASYESLSVNDEHYPELSAALAEVQQESEQQMLQWKQENLASSQKFAQENNYGFSFEYNQDLMLKRADNRVVSFAFQNDEYLGGPHGYIYFYSKNIDTATGKAITLDDVVTDRLQLSEVLISALEKDYPPVSADFDYREIIENQILMDNPDVSPATWTLDAEGMTFYYDEYELGPYSMGFPQVIIPYKKYPELFREEYIYLSKECALELGLSTTQYVDTDGNGELESVSIYAYQKNGGYTGEEINIYINDTQTLYSSSGWFNQAFLIRQKDGSLYLYVSVIEGGDLGCIHVFKIEGENAVYTGDVDGYFSSDVINNPNRFKLYNRLDALGSFEAWQYCYIDENGFPQPEEEVYTIVLYKGEQERYLTAKIPIPVWILTADGTPSNTPEQLPAGTKLYFRRTDNRSFVEMELEDGRRCQVRGDFTTWPKTINGISEYDCFDGIIYAG